MAARAWTKGALSETDEQLLTALPQNLSPEEEDALSDARAFGMDPVEVSKGLKASQTIIHDGMEWEGIFECNLNALKAFLACCNQWRVFKDKVTALDYGAAATAWKMLGISVEPEDFRSLQIIEAEAQRILNGGIA